MEEQESFINEWPKASFKDIAREETEEKFTKFFYKSFFVVLLLPERVVSTFKILFKEESE